MDLATRGLKLDELEVASLRGEVQEASLQLDLGARLGRGAWSVQVGHCLMYPDGQLHCLMRMLLEYPARQPV